jgi:hypothetical protein
MSKRYRSGVLAARLPLPVTPVTPRTGFAKRFTGKWLNTFICPVRLGRCNSLRCDASNNGVCLKLSSGQAACSTVLLRLIRQESIVATRRNPCALKDALYTRTQRTPNADTGLSEDCPKRNDRPTRLIRIGDRQVRVSCAHSLPQRFI